MARRHVDVVDGDGDGDGRLAGGDRERNQKAPTNQRWSLTASS